MTGYLFVALAALCWGLIGPVARVAFDAGMPPLEVAFWRTSIAWVFFASQALISGQYRMSPRDLPLVGVFGIAAIGGLFGFYVLAVRHGGAALASVLLYTAPAWVAVLSRLVLGEALTVFKAAAVAATILGVALVSLGPESGSLNQITNLPRAVGFGLLSGLSYSLFYIFGKSHLGRYRTPTIFLYAMPLACLLLAQFFPFQTHPPRAWIAVLVVALVSTYLSYSLYYFGLKKLDATRAAVVATLEPLAATLLAWFMWDERLGPAGYAGAGLILLAVLTTIWEGARNRGRALTRLSAGSAGGRTT